MELDQSLWRHAPFSRHEFDSSQFEQFGIKMTINIVIYIDMTLLFFWLANLRHSLLSTCPLAIDN